MRIPDVEGLKDAHEALNACNVTIPTPSVGSDDTNGTAVTPAESAAAALGQPQSFGRAAAVLHAANGTSGPASAAPVPPAEKDDTSGDSVVKERQSGGCTKGQAFYVCQNGFTGCCSVNPCNPGQTCPDGQKKGDEGSQTASEKADGRGNGNGANTEVSSSQATETAKETPTRTQTSDEKSTKTSSGIRTATPTGTLASTTSRRVPRPSATAAPDCPKANNKTYKDGFDIPYRIRCNSDNTSESFDSITVGTGGYDQCFSACSQSDKCAGFTYVGLDSGTCYLKAQMSNGTYEGKAGRNYISCAKLDPDDNAAHNPKDKDDSGGKSKGAIIGGVVGGVVFLLLLLLCIALLAKRRRKKIDRKRANVTHVIHGPIETDMTAPPAQPYTYANPQGYYGPPPSSQHQHQRQCSTSHDVFTPYGGNVYDPRTHTRQRSMYGAQTWV